MHWFLSFLAILVFAVAPILPLLTLELLGLADGLNEGNSTIATLPWMLLITLPIGLLALIVWVIAGVAKLAGFLAL